jgi:hypothetical protein
MDKKDKKAPSWFSRLFKKHKIVPVRDEEELTLRFSKDELFDRHVMLPHVEVNSIVYETVDRFTSRYGGEHLNLTIYSDSISDISQQFFREAFVSHYEDEFRQVTKSLFQLNARVILLALISIIAYYAGIFLSVKIAQENFVIIAVTNIGIYCLWEIFSTEFKRKDIREERKRIIRAQDANIIFRTR